MGEREAETRPTDAELRRALEERSLELRDLMEAAHPADVADLLADVDEDKSWYLFSSLSPEQRAEVLEHADDMLRERLVANMSTRDLVRVVEELPPDEVVDLLAVADDAVAEEVLRAVDFERADQLRELYAYEPDTAGGVMTPDFVSVPRGTRVGDAIKTLKEEAEEAEEGLGVFVVDEAGRPAGYLSEHDLLTHSIHAPVEEVMETDIPSVTVDTDQEEAATQIQKYSLDALPVVDAGGVLIGVISAEDAQEILGEEASEDMHRIAGTAAKFPTRRPVLSRVRTRMPLMLVTALGGLTTAHILNVALPAGDAPPPVPGEHGIADVLRYVPIIIGLAGNVGIQSSTILVRAFATGEVEAEQELSVLGSEVLVGTLIGLLCGLTTMLIAPWIEAHGAPDYRFGAAVGCAILVAVSWTSFLGCIVPISCRRIGIDPAIVAGPFLVTLSDVSGSAIFVAIANLFLGLGPAA